MAGEPREGARSWLSPAAAPSTTAAPATSAPAGAALVRPLAASLPVAGAPRATSWLHVTPAPAAEPVPCPGCAELAQVKADLAGARDGAIALGRAEGLAETASVRARLAAAAAAMSARRTEHEAALTETIVDVALGLCEWLAPAAAAIDRRALAPLVSEALATSGTRDVVLRLCADDAAELGTQIPSGVTCEVVADLAPGEVWVEAPRLVVDGRWPTRLAALREPLLALLKAAAPAFELATEDERAANVSQRIALQRITPGEVARGRGRSGS